MSKKLKPNEVSPGLDDLIDLDRAANYSGLSASHLRLLVRRGVIWGKKLGRTWFTTEPEVRRYVSSDRKPGPKGSETNENR
jgi:hypothetical protein